MSTRNSTASGTLELAREFAEDYSPQPTVALLAGSRAKGTHSRNSDYDLVLLYPDLPEGAWREMVSYQNELFEIFAHDLRSLEYFLCEIERPSGEPSLACMVDEGIPVLGIGTPLESVAKKLARDFLASGPTPLDDAGIGQRRYAITDMAEAISNAGSTAQRLAIGSALYAALGNFVLAANGRWTAAGKALPAALEIHSPGMQQAFTSAFEQLYTQGNDSLVQDLVSKTLKPFGGRLRAGFRQQAPASWR